MAHTCRRVKTTAPSTATPNNARLGSLLAQRFIPFLARPSLEHIPNEVLHEILSHLPTLNDRLAVSRLFDSTKLVRTPTLRALSQTSRLLRSRCLAMAWQRIEICAVTYPKHQFSYYRVIGEATKTGVRVLNACPHLLPLIQTVSIAFTRYRSAEIIPAFAACLATLPNLSAIQITYAHFEMATAIKNGFEGKQFPSVRRITLPSSAHHIVKSCPNLEEVTCTWGTGSTVVRSLVKTNRRHLRILRGISAPLPRKLVKVAPNLRHISLSLGRDMTMTMLTNFPLLDTIELHTCFNTRGLPLIEAAASEVKDANKLLRENKAQAEKTVIVTRWYDDMCPETEDMITIKV